MRAGFIGLGSQGLPMARRIADAGIPTTVWARRPDAASRAKTWGADLAPSPAVLGAACDVVGVCVFDATGVREVLFGPEGLTEGMAPGGVVTVHSTVSPGEIAEIAERAGECGLVVLDAPVSGGPDAAAAGELLVLLAGPAEAAERARPVLESYAGQIIRFGEVGAAQLAKLFNNALLAAQVALVADTVRVGRAHGLGEGLLDVIRGGSARGLAADLLAGYGSVAGLATRSQFGPTIAKDVGLLVDVLGDADSRAPFSRAPLVSLATDLARQLGNAVAAPSETESTSE